MNLLKTCSHLFILSWPEKLDARKGKKNQIKSAEIGDEMDYDPADRALLSPFHHPARCFSNHNYINLEKIGFEPICMRGTGGSSVPLETAPVQRLI